MRARKTTLLSIGLGAVLLLWFGLDNLHRKTDPWERSIRTETDTHSTHHTHTEPAAPSTGPAAVPASKWTLVESADLRTFAENLRATGCPEQTVRDIVTARIWRNYQARLKTLQANTAFMRNPTSNSSYAESRQLQQQSQELTLAMQRDLETTLGVSASKLIAAIHGWPAASRMGESELDFLPMEKRSLVRETQLRYQIQTREAARTLSSTRSQSLPRESAAELEASKRQELGTLLTPREVEEMTFRESAAARFVINQLPEAGTETEFRRMVEAVQSAGVPAANPVGLFQRFGLPAGPSSKEAETGNSKALDAVEAAVVSVLGETRYKQLKEEEQARVTRDEARHNSLEEQRTRAFNLLQAESMGFGTAESEAFLDRLKQDESTLRHQIETRERARQGSEVEIATRIEAALQKELDNLALQMLGTKGPALIKKLNR